MSLQSTSKAQSLNDDSSRQEPPQSYVMNQTEEQLTGNEISDLTVTVSQYTIKEEEKANDLAIDPTKNARCGIVDGEHLSVNSCKGTQMEAVKSSDVNAVETLTDSTDVEPGEHIPPVTKDEAKNGLTDDRYNNTTHIRISNFSETMALPDLMKLLKPIGPSKKVYLARDRASGLCKGFAFVNFRASKSATKAIEMLNGQLYNDKMLKVEYSTPKTQEK
ncbi:hypothetical protein HA402_008992 [Bradysia odoriphaga]|nr:hypothetical protein HA402_008992 [Bradysia odoriphaga]